MAHAAHWLAATSGDCRRSAICSSSRVRRAHRWRIRACCAATGRRGRAHAASTIFAARDGHHRWLIERFGCLSQCRGAQVCRPLGLSGGERDGRHARRGAGHRAGGGARSAPLAVPLRRGGASGPATRGARHERGSARYARFPASRPAHAPRSPLRRHPWLWSGGAGAPRAAARRARAAASARGAAGRDDAGARAVPRGAGPLHALPPHTAARPPPRRPPAAPAGVAGAARGQLCKGDPSVT